MRAEVIAIGSELTSGQKLDTNSQWLSQRLGELGVDVRFHTTLADDLGQNVDVLRIARSRAQLVIVSGGLGPTQDDLTREALATMADVPLIEDEASLSALTAFFERRNRVMPPRNRVQALLPEGATPLPNRSGTAPGIWLESVGTVFAALPGVPGEMKTMFDEQLVPRLQGTERLGPVRVHRVINLFGRGESDFEAEALDLTARGREPEVGITASDATISFRITAEAADSQAALDATEPTARLIYERFGEWIVGEGDVDVVEALIQELEMHQATLAVAESCTGGMVAQRLTDHPGVSRVFLGGVVCYANQAKIDLLGLPPAVLAEHGAVSSEVAEAIAAGARDRFGATLGLGITGVAGPDGGTPEKPVGLVYLGLATRHGVEHRRLLLGADQSRPVIRSRAAKHAMNWARVVLNSEVRGHGPAVSR
jgi:nicotinamide-nucleotide amidase